LLSFLITAGNNIINARYYCIASISNNAAIADVIHAVTVVVTAITLPLDDISNPALQ